VARTTGYAAPIVGRNYRTIGVIGGSLSTYSSNGSAITTNFRERIILPPHSYKAINGYNLIDKPVPYCSTKEIRNALSDSLATLPTSTPFQQIAYRISYSTTENGPLREISVDLKLIRTTLFYPSRFFKTAPDKDCNASLGQTIEIPLQYKPSRFFIPIWSN
jgi:hypothetical protein